MSPIQTERETPPRAYDDPEEEDYPMPHRYESAAANHSGSDREISLGTGTILAIFFLLALVCSVFFGFGYTMGHKSNPLSTVTATDSPSRGLSDAFKSFKPAPGGPAATGTPAKASSTEEAEAPAPSSTSVVVPATSPRSAATAAAKKPFDPDAEIVTSANPAPATKAPAATHATPALRTDPAITALTTPTPSPAAGAIVQVAAVTHQEDADTIVSTLKRKGYTVDIRREPQDKFLHIQLGPYPTKKDAEAMRQRLQADGFNPILK